MTDGVGAEASGQDLIRINFGRYKVNELWAVDNEWQVCGQLETFFTVVWAVVDAAEP